MEECGTPTCDNVLLDALSGGARDWVPSNDLQQQQQKRRKGVERVAEAATPQATTDPSQAATAAKAAAITPVADASIAELALCWSSRWTAWAGVQMQSPLKTST